MRSAPPPTFSLLAALAFGLVLTATPAVAAQVTAFTPQGTVKQVRQASAVFSDPVVAFGDLGAANPFEIKCPVGGTGRWVDAAQWVYDFERDLPAGLSCVFRLRGDLKTLAGHPVTGTAAFVFSTGGPAIKSSLPREGSEWIDEEQAFVLLLDAEPTDASLRRHVGFAVEGIPQRVDIRVLTGEAREEILKARLAEPPRGPVLVVQAVQRFPSRARVILVWDKGVAAEGGVATEKEQALHFRVRDPFTVRIDCERENRNAGCVPITPLRLRFSAPVAMDAARRVTLRASDGRQWPPRFEDAGAPWADGLTFKGPFPEQTELRLALPPDLTDDAGRSPVNKARFPLAVKMDAFPPLAKFPARSGIIEAQADAALPVTVRNLEPQVLSRLVNATSSPQEWKDWVQGRIARIPPSRTGDILPWLRRVATAERDKSVFAGADRARPPVAFGLPKPNGADVMEVIGIPLAGPGFYVLELASPRLGAALLGKRAPMYVPAAALVTNLAVHFKWGVANSLAWVTALDSARPVADASVSVHDCAGTVLWSGRTDPQGLARMESLPARAALPTCSKEFRYYDGLGQLDGGLFITARRGDDLAFVHSSWDQGIEPWRFRLPTTEEAEPIIAHTVLDRALFRAGETVSMKHLIRRPLIRGLGPVAADERPTSLVIRHLGSDEKYELPLSWDAGGTAEGTWAIPRSAKLGSYEVIVRGPVKGDLAPEAVSARFQVQEFRVPLMKAVLRPPAEPLIAVAEFSLDIGVQYLAGGGAPGLPVVLRAQVNPKRVAPVDGFED